MQNELNAKRLAEAIDSYNVGGHEELNRFLADDIVWHVGGRHQLSGIYRGRAAVVEYHRRAAELSGRTLLLEPTDIIAGESHVTAVLRVSGERNGRVLDTTLLEVIALDDEGRWIEYRALSENQDQIDAFWA